MTPLDHHCVIDSVHGGGAIGLCSCGQAWIPAGPELRNLYLVSPDLRHRLKCYKQMIATGRAADLRDAIRKGIAYEAAWQAAERAKARDAWYSRQSGKRAKWMRVMRGLLLPAACTYCGGIADCLDHIIPRTRGGLDRRSNITPACTHCNTAKRDRTPEEWMALRAKRRQPWPPPWGAIAGPGSAA